MLDFKEQALKLRKMGFMQGQRPLMIKILKSKEYSYRKKYVVTICDKGLYFYQLNFKYNYKKRRAIDFMINYDKLSGYHFALYNTYHKKITLYFKDGLEFNFIFFTNCSEAYDNEANAEALMKKLKEMKVFQKNMIKGGKNGQKTISKSDQNFVKEIRSPKKRRGLFS